MHRLRPLHWCWAVALLATARPAFAQIRVQAEPIRSTIDARAGEPVARDVAITNLGETPVVVRVRWSDWTIDAVGEMALLPPGTLPTSLAAGVSFEPRTFSLAAGETGRIHVVLTLPADGPATGWGVLLSEVRPAAPVTPARGPRAIAELGSTFYLTRVPAARLSPELIGLDLTPIGADSLAVRARVRNAGERHLYVTGEVSLADSAGAAVRAGTLPTGVVLPGRIREFTWMCDARLPLGAYTVTATLDTGQPELLVGEAKFTVPPTPAAPLPVATRR